MKKLNKIFTGLSILILLSLFFVNLRKVDETTFQLMIQDDIYQLEKVCLKVDNTDKNELPYNFYIKKYGTSVCSDSEKLFSVVKKEIKLMYLKKLRFVY